MISILRTVMQILDLRQSQIETRLGWSVSYLSRLFSGDIQLRFEHVIDISRAMGLRPEELLRFAYPAWGEPPSEAGGRVREVIAMLSPPPAGGGDRG